MMNTIKTFLIVLMMNVCCVNYAFSATLLDFNEPGSSDSHWPGWAWWPDSADDFGNPGWRRDSGRWFFSGSDWRPRVFAKSDYGNSNNAMLDTTERAPSTTEGASLKIYDTGNTSTHQSSYWYMFGDNNATRGVADSSTDRFSFYFKVKGMNDPNSEDWNNMANFNIEVGTYLCWDGGGLGGENCPKEANGQHYYHQMTVNNGAWLHVLLDRHPQHQRGGNPGDVRDNPVSPKDYYAFLNDFYIEVPAPQVDLTSYWVDEMELWTTTQPENDMSIASVWVGYWPTTDKWEISFRDSSFSLYNDLSGSTFEIRYSTNPITNANFSSATPITPEYHRVAGTSFIRRPHTWITTAWTRFVIPDAVESNNAVIYFAIKDMSISGGHKGSYPYGTGDGHNAPSSNIHTIDYSIANVGNTNTSPPPPPSTDISAPSPPQNLTITLGQ